MPALKPFLLERKILGKVWGGRALEQALGLTLPAGEQVGETWELYDRPEGSSVLRGSATTLAELMATQREELLGRGVKPGHGGKFPLLIKYIDAREALSVQVHPDEEQARARGDGGKNEAWIVLQKGPNARIIRGTKPGVTEEQFRAVAATAAVEELLWKFTPEVGDCIHVPAGTVHAIGPDVVVFEVQQNSDLTYRLYDWGRPREVHVQDALAVTRLGAEGTASGGRPVVPPQQLPDGSTLVVEAPQFRVRRFTVAPTAQGNGRMVLPTEGTFQVVNVTAGRGVLGWHSAGNDQPLFLQTGDCAVVPACIEQVFFSPIGRMELLVSGPGRQR